MKFIFVFLLKKGKISFIMIALLSNESDYQTGFTYFDKKSWSEESDSPGIITTTSPVAESPFPAKECVASWNIISGHNGWSEIFLRAKVSQGWTTWYRMGLWAAEGAYFKRFSLSSQDDEHAKVETDVLSLKEEASAFQMRIRLSETRKGGLPSLQGAALTWSSQKLENPSEVPSHINSFIDIENMPAHSQLEYKDGGNSWCSPTSLSMVIQHWRDNPVLPEAAVREAVRGTYDPLYGGNGNWSFNAAWAGSMGYRAYVRRFTSLKDLLPYLEKNIPIILSVSWNKEKERPMDNGPMKSTNGHLTVLKGFDGKGNALMHEPASPCNDEVPREYRCDQLQARWLEASGGTAYIVMPALMEDPGLC